MNILTVWLRYSGASGIHGVNAYSIDIMDAVKLGSEENILAAKRDNHTTYAERATKTWPSWKPASGAPIKYCGSCRPLVSRDLTQSSSTPSRLRI